MRLADALYLSAELPEDDLAANMRLAPETMEELIDLVPPHDAEMVWQFTVEPLRQLVHRHGLAAVATALLQYPYLALHELELFLKHHEFDRETAMYTAQMAWLIASQLHALLGRGTFPVPDALTALEEVRA